MAQESQNVACSLVHAAISTVTVESHFPRRWIGRRRLNEWPAQRPILTACDFCGTGPKMKSPNQDQEHLMNWNNRLEIFCCCFSWRL